MCCAMSGNAASAMILIDRRADVNVVNAFGHSGAHAREPLAAAVSDAGRAALHTGVEAGHASVVKLLIEHRADVFARCVHGANAPACHVRPMQ